MKNLWFFVFLYVCPPLLASPIKRSTSSCQGMTGYGNLRKVLIPPTKEALMKASNIINAKYFNTTMKSTSEVRMTLQPTKVDLRNFFPSGKVKPLSMEQYTVMLNFSHQALSQVSIADADITTKLNKVAKQIHDDVTLIDNVRKQLWKCSEYDPYRNKVNNFNPNDFLYTYAKLHSFFTMNQTDEPSNHIEEKIARTVLNAVTNIVNTLDDELKQRMNCL